MKINLSRNNLILLVSGLAIIIIFIVIFMFANSSNKTQPANSSATNADNIVLNVAVPYPAPELMGITNWINTSPLKLSDLKGKVVLIDFWTYSCINCLRTLPYLKDWNDKYKDKGLVIIGVHAPEFSFEKVNENVERFVKDAGITYPVAQDNDFDTWRAYDNEYWPAKYFIDKNGLVRHTHFGEGDYTESEMVIQKLLAEGNSNAVINNVQDNDNVPVRADQTPESYLGYDKIENMFNSDQVKPDESADYTSSGNLDANTWALQGKWNVGNEFITSQADNSILRFNVSAKEVYLVMGADQPKVCIVSLNGKVVDNSNKGDDVDSNGKITIQEYKLYKLIKLPDFASNQLLEINCPSGVKMNAFTFGS